jgi:TolA-binding protein
MKDAEKLRLIETFYQGDISSEDQKVFDNLLNDDANFQQEVRSFEPIFKGFEALHIEHFEQQLLSFEKKHQSATKEVSMSSTSGSTTVLRPLKKFYYAAAAIAVLLVALVGYKQFTYAPFENNFVAEANIAIHLSSMRAASMDLSDEEVLTRDAFTAYQSNDYEATINLLEKYQKEYPNIAAKDYQSYLVLGVAQLAIGHAEASKSSLIKILDAEDSSNKLTARWYLSLAEVKLQNYDAASKLLNELINSDDNKLKKDAEALLNDL